MKNVNKSQILCIMLGITLGAAAGFVERTENGQYKENQLIRAACGQGDREESILVDGLSKERTEITVHVGEKTYTKEEAEEAFPKAFQILSERAKGKNRSWDEIREPLKLDTWVEEYGMSAEWESEQRNRIDPSGEIFNENCSEKGEKCRLKVHLKTGEFTHTYVIQAILCPPGRSKEEQTRLEFETLLKKLDEKQKTSQYFFLPEEFQGKELHYERKRSGDGLIFPALGILAAVLLPLKDRQKEEEEKKKRERELLLDYSEVVSKLVIFLGSGMSLRRSWERIIRDYEEKRAENGTDRAVYEEMKQTYYRMERGLPETRAYVEFGKNCRLLPYRKLAGMLEQNVKNGTDGLKGILEREMEDAFIQRKLLAKKMGEEAGTKLLVPLIMMLSVVMVILTVPAFLSFGL